MDDIDDIEDIEDEDEEIILRHQSNEPSELLLGLPSFATGKITSLSFFYSHIQNTNGTSVQHFCEVSIPCTLNLLIKNTYK